MSIFFRVVFATALVISIAALALWAATGFHYYTKYEVVERVEMPVDANDPFAQTGLFEHGTETKVVTRDEFHLGLLPTPQSLFDKHLLSVLSLVIPAWAAVVFIAWFNRRGRNKSERGSDSSTGGAPRWPAGES